MLRLEINYKKKSHIAVAPYSVKCEIALNPLKFRIGVNQIIAKGIFNNFWRLSLNYAVAVSVVPETVNG